MSGMKQILITTSFIILITNLTLADWKENAEAIDISGGESHTLVLTKNKAPWACGYNEFYQLGIGDDANDQLTLVRVHGGDMGTTYLEDINDVDAGWQHSLALDVNDFVWSWGNNGQGQLGDDSTDRRSTPVQVHDGDMNTSSGYLEDIIDISAGRSGEHSLAVDANNFVYAWGRNEEGQCGNNESGNSKLTPVLVHNGEMDTASDRLEDILAVSAGEKQSMAMDANGFVWTWGNNAYGKLGNGTYDPCTTPVQVKSGQQNPNDPNSFLNNIVAISAGWDHCMALEEIYPFDPNRKGRVYTWGRNTKSDYGYYGGRLGDGTTDSNSTPVIVLSGEQDPNNPDSYLEGIIAVSAGESHSMALDVNGFIYTWGDNTSGQLGNGTNDPCTTPVRVVGLNGEGYLKNIVAISAGFWHNIAIDADGTIWTWGRGAYGQLGLGNKTNNPNIPHPINVVYNDTRVPKTFYFGIQNAINHADNNDVVVASPGTYYENIDFLTKTITLRSTAPNNWDAVEKTIIQGSGESFIPVVKFNNNPNSVLTGFTLTNGDDGMHCDSSSPEITNSIIKNSNYWGIYCTNTSSIKVKNTKIINNGIDNNHDGINCSNTEIMLSNCLIENNGNRGIYCSNSDSNITDCNIANNNDDGIYCLSSNLTVSKCTIRDNDGEGIYNSNSSSAVITNNIICRNKDNGIYSYTSGEIEIKNNWIYGNGTDNSGDGIHISNAYPVDAVIRNNTIADNNDYGIYSNYATDVTVSNCIIWGNGDGSLHKVNEQFDNIIYSCIEGGFAGTGNINDDPCFANDANDNYHINPGSPCIDKGNPAGNYPNETDIDGEPRVIDGDANDTEIVDMGADEFYWSAADLNLDEIVNFFDYAVFANAWQTTSGGPGWNTACDLAANGIIDYNDLAVFCEDWLWIAAWKQTLQQMMMGQGMGQTLTLMEGVYRTTAAKQPAELLQQPQPELSPADIEELLKWLDELWLNGDLKDWTEQEYLEFRKAIEESL